MLKKVKVNKTVIVVGHQHQSVRTALKDQKVSFALQSKQLGTAHAVVCAKNTLRGFSGDVLVLAGDAAGLKRIKNLNRKHLLIIVRAGKHPHWKFRRILVLML